jgi:alpha-glucosidase
MFVVYEMPLAMLADYPEAYEGLPEFDFLERVPTVWNDTKVLNGEPAKYVTIARQHGDAWYVGSITNWEPRDLDIPLSFLGGGKISGSDLRRRPRCGPYRYQRERE